MPVETFVGRGAGAFIENKLFQASQYILICSPWISQHYASKLCEIAKKGVQIKIITSSDQANLEHVEALKTLKAALTPQKDFLGRIKKDWAPPPLDIKIVDERFIHAKIYCFDGVYAVVGSANLTEAGFFKNVEHIVIFKNTEDVERIENDFGQLWVEYSGIELVEEKLGISKVLPRLLRIFKREKTNNR
jgi:phosphatidylserine/phosphatidylglycerophosphate/cardiolipin synthase-like enzyme